MHFHRQQENRMPKKENILCELVITEAALPELAAAMVSQRATKIGYAERLDAKGKKFVELLEVSQVAEGEYSLS